jgi:hypothetical protein
VYFFWNSFIKETIFSQLFYPEFIEGYKRLLLKNGPSWDHDRVRDLIALAGPPLQPDMSAAISG